MHQFRALFAVAASVALAGPLTSSAAFANAFGPLSGSAGTGCGNGCHGPALDPVITLEAPFTVDEEDVLRPLRVSVSHPMAGGGGFMLAASSGRILIAENSGMKNSAPNEATHDGTQLAMRSWSMDWVLDGPVHGCNVEVRVAAMASNDDARDQGDRWDFASATMAVEPKDDTVSPDVPVFLTPEQGDVVNDGGPVRALKGTSPRTVVFQSVEFLVKTNDDIGVREVLLLDVDPLGVESELGPARFDPKWQRWGLHWSTEGVTPGPHEIRAVVTDCAGNVSQSSIDIIAL